MNRERSVGRDVAWFAASGLAALILLGGLGVELLRHVGRSEAIRDAKSVTALAGRGVVAPAVGGVADRDPRAIRRIDTLVRNHVLGHGVVRVKIWSPSGRILYSDEKRLIGRRYSSLGADEVATLERGGVDAEVSDLAKPENRYERRYGKLLEVYLPIRDPSGRPLLFETYLRYSSVAASGARLWQKFAPAILGALVVLWLVQLPLAWRLACRLRQGQREREALLRHAIEASEIERRRIARDLHDGAVQSLAGVSYSLSAAADRANGDTALVATLRSAATSTRQTVRELRTLLVDIYPPDLHRTGLQAALKDLVAGLPARGIDVELDLPDQLSLPPELEALFFRCAQEALRNTVEHAHAHNVEVKLACSDGVARLTVEDDGRGFSRGDEGRARAGGHLGLRLLSDLARDAGGKLEITTTANRGTCVCVEAPLP